MILKKEFKCDVCGTNFTTKLGMKSHRRWHNLPQYKSFQKNFRSKIVKKDNRIELSNEEKQVILGSLLGDGSLAINKGGVNAFYREIHSLNQEEYILWKFKYFKKFDVRKKRGKTFDMRTKKEYHRILIWTKTHPQLTTLHKLFYNEKKRLTNEVLGLIECMGLAVWYMDDGYYSYGRNRCYLSTNCFSYEEHVVIKEWFREKWDIEVQIHKSGKAYNIHFSGNNAEKFLKLVEPFIIKSLKYKLGQLIPENLNKITVKQNSARIQKRQYRKFNRQKVLDSNKRSYKKHREKRLKNSRAYSEKNKSNILSKAKDYYKKNREEIRKKQKNYRLKKLIKDER